MKRMTYALCVLMVGLTASVASAAIGTPVTNNTTAVGNTNVVTVTIPGLVGVDLESNLTWDFSLMTAATASSTCTQSGNHWPISVRCASGAVTDVLYDPTNDTNPGVNFGTAPTNSGALPGGTYETITPGTKAIWLAFFCSKGGAGIPAVSVTLSGLNNSPSGFNESNIQFKGDTNSNAFAVTGPNGSSYSAFTAGGNTVQLDEGTMTATFGWTRADQIVTMRLDSNSALATTAGSPLSVTHTGTLLYTITKP